LVDHPIPPKNCAQSNQPPFQTPQYRQISARSASTTRAGKKVQLALIGSQTGAFHKPWINSILDPKGGTKRDFAVFASKIQLLSKKSATKFLCVKTSSDKVVATSFLYLKVHRRIAGDIHI